VAGLIVSADSHTLEPEYLWQKYLPPRSRDRIRIIKEHRGKKGDYIYPEGMNPFPVTSLGSAGIPPERVQEFTEGGYTVCRSGGWDPVERIKDMTLDGVDAEVLYCGLTMFLYGCQDLALQKDAFQAYNTWAAEYCSYNPKRLIGVASVSIHDLDWSLREIERVTKAGMRGILISADPPAERRYGDRVYDPLWAECERLGLPVTMHILTGSSGTGAGPDHIVQYMKMPMQIATSVCEMITLGVFERFPNLKVVAAENDAGWIAHYLNRLSHASYRWSYEYPEMKQSGDFYWRRNVRCTFQDDVAAVATRHMVGVETLMWASDYPHFDSTWPKSREFIEKNFGDIPEAEQRLFLGENMARLYNIDLN
jgi:predicted TIM-barrel fold metal-dependent hydrolase